jgi:hypothetical protein
LGLERVIYTAESAVTELVQVILTNTNSDKHTVSKLAKSDFFNKVTRHDYLEDQKGRDQK